MSMFGKWYICVMYFTDPYLIINSSVAKLLKLGIDE